MNKDIKDAIKKNLPEATAGALKERLEELEAIEQQVPELKETLNALEIQLRKLNLELSKHREIDTREKNVQTCEIELQDEAVKLSTREEILAIREAMANDRVDDHINMFQLVFRNEKISTNVVGQADNGQLISRTTKTEST